MRSRAFLRSAICIGKMTVCVSYNKKIYPHHTKLLAVLSGLVGKIPPPEIVIISPLAIETSRESWGSGWLGWDDFIADGKRHQLGRTRSGEIQWNRLHFDAPLWILFSSGTTGRPKCVMITSTYCHHITYETLIDRSCIAREACSSSPGRNLSYVLTSDSTMYFSTTRQRRFNSCLSAIPL